MNSSREKSQFVRLYLGIAGRKERGRIFRSKESEHRMQIEWETFRDVRHREGELDKDKLLLNIRKQISPDGFPSGRENEMSFIRKYAAILIIGLVLGSAGIYFGMVRQFGQKPAMVELMGASDGKSEYLLPDGSRVSLNANTTLTYPESFSKKNRSVSLSGEAYFEVQHDETKPFLLSTPGVEIEVLGTTFNVKANPGDTFVETVLVAGKVRISRFNPVTRRSQSVILTPNHKAVFIAEEEKFILDKVDVHSAISWRSATLSFDNALLEEVVRELGGRYGVKISLSEALSQAYRITMTIDRETLEEVLTIIEKTLPLDYKRVDNEIIFYPSP